MSSKQKKFILNNHYFICPKCREILLGEENSLKCTNNHSFDIAKKGYINFLLKQRNTDGYNGENFKYRNTILNNGYYDHILETIISKVKEFSPSSVMDIGCGEGFYSKKIEELVKGTDILAFDFSKDAINIASRGVTDILFFIADIGNIPAQNKTLDMVLNIYTPANYKEFKRILKDDGIIMKVIPGKNHLKELREIVKKSLKNESYDNKDVIDIFNEKCTLLESISACKTYSIQGNDIEALIKMTPMLFSKDKKMIEYSSIKEITIDAVILIGKIK